MKTMLHRAMIAAAMAIVMTGTMLAQIPAIPHLISYQGLLTRPGGAPLANGSYQITFRLYGRGGTTDEVQVWQETQVVAVYNGHFNALIGATTPLNIPFDRSYMLGISVNGEPELLPRTMMTPAPYSLYAVEAGTARSVAPGAIDANAIADGAITSSKLAPGAIPGQVLITNGTTVEWGTPTTAGVTSLNGATGAVTLRGGGGTSVQRNGNELVIYTSPGAVSSINSADAAIGITNPTGPAVTLSLNPNGITTPLLADWAVTTPKIAPNAVTNDKIAYGISYSKLIGAPTSLPPMGPAGGDLTGLYPNPSIAPLAVQTGMIRDTAVTTAKIADHAVTKQQLAPASVGTNKIEDGAVTNAKLDLSSVSSANIIDGTIITADIANAAITDAKVANGIAYSKLSGAPTSLPPNGPAGGDLVGTYPNPSIAPLAVQTEMIADLAVTKQKLAPASVGTNKIEDGAVTNAKLAADAVSSLNIIDGTIITADIANSAITDAKVATGISYSKLTGAPTSLPPSGAAGGDLTGTYPNPTVALGAITTGKLADGSVTTAKVVDGAITTVKLGDGSVTTAKVADGAITDAKVANGISYSKLTGAPAALPPMGPAGGDLTGAYPNPTIAPATVTTAKLADASVTTAKINSTGASAGQVLGYNGTSVVWTTPSSGGLTLPYSGSATTSGAAFAVTNNGTGYAASFIGGGSSSQGVSISSGAGEIGLNISRGRMILSYGVVSDGQTVPNDVSVVLIPDNGISGNSLDVTMPTATELGQVLMIYNDDANQATTVGIAHGPDVINSHHMRTYIYTGAGWIAQD